MEPMSRKQILVIEDQQEICRTIEAILQRCGYDVVVASGTKEALELLRDNPELRPCIILADPFAHDVNMASLAALLRQDDHLAVIPVQIFGGMQSQKPPYLDIARPTLSRPEALLEAVRQPR
jgi:CheY-like chemotaxis protein